MLVVAAVVNCGAIASRIVNKANLVAAVVMGRGQLNDDRDFIELGILMTNITTVDLNGGEILSYRDTFSGFFAAVK